MSNEIIEISGIAHIALNVSEIEQSKKFYKELLPSIGLKLVHESEKSCYHIGGKTGILIQQISENNNYIEFSQKNIGLHHLCFRARSKEDVNKIDYLEIREEENLQLTEKKTKARLFIAFYLGEIRIIDNFILY